ncbi:MAG TPA: hypothetical protein VFM68_02710 [Candidatus Saccharimonadales bacterium]|nr:hypothetical protein [Candidatus Saccharimonadales bacterium]
MASRKPAKRIGTPDSAITNFEAFNADLSSAIKQLHRVTRNEQTRQRRHIAVDKEIDARNVAINEMLDPLLDRVFTYTVEHWDELAPRQSPENAKLNAVTFKRHIDKIGTKSANEKEVIAYLRNIQNSDMMITLRKVLGDEVADELVSRLKVLVTRKIVSVLDSETLKEIVKEQPLLTIPGFNIDYNNTLTMVVHQSATEKRKGKPPIKEVRSLPNP